MRKINRLTASALVAAAGMTALPQKTASPEQDMPAPMEWVCTPEDIPRVEKAKNIIRKLFKRQEYQKIHCRWEVEKVYSATEQREIVQQFRALVAKVSQTQIGIFDRNKRPTEVCIFNRAWMRSHDRDIAKVWKYLLDNRSMWSRDMVDRLGQIVGLGKGIPGTPNDVQELTQLVTQKIPGAKRSACGLAFTTLAAPFTNRLATAQSLGEGLLRDAYQVIGTTLSTKKIENTDVAAAHAFIKAFEGAERIRPEDMQEK